MLFHIKLVILHVKNEKMMKIHPIIALCCAALMTSCTSEFNRIYKMQDNAYKYEYAKECFAMGKFQHAAILLSEQVTLQKGRKDVYTLG